MGMGIGCIRQAGASMVVNAEVIWFWSHVLQTGNPSGCTDGRQKYAVNLEPNQASGRWSDTDRH